MELAPAPATVALLALRAQVVAANVNVAAGLHVASSRNKPATSPRALEAAIIVDDLADAAVEAIERGANPVTTYGLAYSAKRISLSLDFPASL
jgi:hypothetical protein